jgi:hypothetical protein
MTPAGPLARRIAARRGEVIAPPDCKPTPQTAPKAEPWRPPWLRNLEAKDMTGRVLS